MRCLEAQVNGRRDSGVRTEDGVGQFEEGVAPTVEAFVERAAETVESIGTFHDAPIMHWPTTLRIPYLPVELKRKLSSWRGFVQKYDDPRSTTSPECSRHVVLTV
jgi:hypothetical protein